MDKPEKEGPRAATQGPEAKDSSVLAPAEYSTSPAPNKRAAIHKTTKIGTVLGHLAAGRSLNRFDAERIGDHALHSTVSAIQHVHGWSFPEAVAAVAGVLGMDTETPAPRPQPAPKPKPQPTNQDVRRRRKALRRVWRESYPVQDPTDAPILASYLRHRGLAAILEDLPGNLRFHPALGYWEAGDDGPRHVGNWPALLAVVRDPGGQPVTLHRTYLTHRGEKAPVDSPRKLMAAPMDGATKGGAIRLYAPGSTLAVAEGIETALSVRAATGWPVWSTICAPLMARLELPDGLDELLVAADADRAGLDAAETLSRRAARRGIQARVAVPPEPGTDWNDVMGGAA